MTPPTIIFAFIESPPSIPLLVYVTFQFLHPHIEAEEIQEKAEPDADRDDQHDVELMLGQEIHSYPFG